ncbi:helix-turn-helix transcriptional regulator [Streptomyces sp. NPDC092307]|uniref:helix-turn-helix transcriptional regulator n=1 Tax=Streptomyces sp. NPDC092307 TaxID=3366013 RepID=UPI0037F3B3B4
MHAFRYSSTDPDESAHFFSNTYAHMRSSVTGRIPLTQIPRLAVGQVALDAVRVGYVLEYAIEPLGALCLTHVIAGRIACSTRTSGELDEVGPGQCPLVAQPDEGHRARVDDTRHQSALIDPALVNRAAATGARDQGAVRFTSYQPVTPAANRQLAATLTFLRGLFADLAVDPPHFLVDSTTRLLATAALAAFPNTACQDAPTLIDTRDSRSDTLRRGVAFIEDNAHHDISLADIAASVPVTPRALQYAFSRHAGTTPLAYLRRVRLAHAHDDLRAADPTSGATVSEIASRWGFMHPGRFAIDYKAAYGVSPRTTLVT